MFVLGAGVNNDYGLPDWPKLLARLMCRSGRVHTAPDGLAEEGVAELMTLIIGDPLLQGAAARRAYRSPALWLNRLSDSLHVDGEQLRDPKKPLFEIARIVAHQYRADRRRHVAVLTFNYDESLEEALRFQLGDETVVSSVASAHTFALARHRSGIFVYHLHGSIGDAKSDIVLDAASYVKILAAPGHHWSWDCMNMFLFKAETGAVFIGLSLLDPSLRLLLTQSAAKRLPLAGVYIAKPLPRLEHEDAKTDRLLAFIARDIQALFDEFLEEISLVPYHVADWSETVPLLRRIVPLQTEETSDTRRTA